MWGTRALWNQQNLDSFFFWVTIYYMIIHPRFLSKIHGFVNFLNVNDWEINRQKTDLPPDCNNNKNFSRYNERVDLTAIKSKETRAGRLNAFSSLCPLRPFAVIIISPFISGTPDALQSTFTYIISFKEKKCIFYMGHSWEKIKCQVNGNYS